MARPATSPPTPPPPPPCERCRSAPRFGRIRFCKACKKSVLRELDEAGYLEPLPPKPAFRPAAARQEMSEKIQITSPVRLRSFARRKQKRVLTRRLIL